MEIQQNPRNWRRNNAKSDAKIKSGYNGENDGKQGKQDETTKP